MSVTADQSLQSLWASLPSMADPYPYYARLREAQPVFAAPGSTWYVTSYELTDNILRHPRLWASDAANALAPDPYLSDPHDGLFARVYRSIIMFQDGEAHRRLRRLVQPVFAHRAMEQFRGRIGRAVASQLDMGLQAHDSDHEMDLKADFTLPMPTKIILDMLGFPNTEAYRFYETTDVIIPPADRGTPEEWFRHADEVYARHWDFIVDGALQRRANPQDDLLTEIAFAADNGSSLTDLEIVGFVTFLITAGYETTANTFTNGVYSLLKFPDQLTRLRNDRSLVPQAVEEMLRFEPATRNTGPRYATEDTQLGGQLIRRGERVLCSVHGANRDPARFPDPNVFDITRNPNPHLSFAAGPHACLGLVLARIELQEALTAVLDRLPDLRLAAEPTWHPSFTIRGLDTLPVRW